MGVDGLQTFLQKNASNEYCKEVDVKELAAQYKRETGKEPVLLVDGNNCLRSESLFGFNTEDKLLGGQMQEFIKAMKDLVAAFEVIYDDSAFLAACSPELKCDNMSSCYCRSGGPLIKCSQFMDTSHTLNV
jgi:hypothetical protein